jgi:hypothetical protein
MVVLRRKDWGRSLEMSRTELTLLTAGRLEDTAGGFGRDVVAVVLGSLVGTFSVIASAWLAVLGFAGGAVPVLGWVLPGGLVHGLRFLAVLATGGVLVLWVLPFVVSMAVYAVLTRLVPGLAKAPRPRRAAVRHDRSLDRAA